MKQIDYNEDNLPRLIAEGNLNAFEHLFKSRYEELFRYSAKITLTSGVAEEIVQDVFVSIWERRTSIKISGSVKTYLYSAVKNKSIDYLRANHTKIQQQFLSETEASSIGDQPESFLETQELAAIIQQGINALPAQCKKIFLLSREAGLTYDEIATTLSISPKTVKAQVAIGLKKMRDYLDGHWDKIIILIISTLQNI